MSSGPIGTGQPCALVIFGATGDLTRRKLVPSLVALHREGLLSPGFAVVGFARRGNGMTRGSSATRCGKVWPSTAPSRVATVVTPVGAATVPTSRRSWTRSAITRRTTTEPDGYEDPQEEAERGDGPGLRNRRQSAVLPGDAAQRLRADHPPAQGMPASVAIAVREDRFTRVIVEKPIGHDLDSAVALNDADPGGLQGAPGLPDRPLPGQGDGPRTSWRCGSPTGSSSPSGTRSSSTTYRSRWPRRSAWRAVAATSRRRGSCGT